MGLTCGVDCVAASSATVGGLELQLQIRFFFRFLPIWVRFWEVLGGPNGSKNRFLKGFQRCFFRVRLGIDFLVIFSCFFRVQTLIFVRTASVLEDFHKIDGFLKRY